MIGDLVLRYPARAVSSRVRLRRGGLAELGTWTRRVAAPRQVALVADPRVASLYGDEALRSLRRAGIAATVALVPRGERAKQAPQLARLWTQFERIALDRADAVVALGGGVVGDLAGFAAATWLRGIRWVCVPTTVVAQVDSSIGGKTAIDLAGGKNLAGAFHQPCAVLVDPDLLQTLPDRDYRAGMAEVVKMGAAVDRGLFHLAERHAERLMARDPVALLAAIGRSITAKARVVEADEREREGGRRTALNFGHTLGHAIEAAQRYRGLRHGEAVAIGMRVAARLSVRYAGLDAGDEARLDRLLGAWRLPARIPGLSCRTLIGLLGRDKKRRAGAVRWVLTPRLGHASVPRLIPMRVVRAALVEAGARA